MATNSEFKRKKKHVSIETDNNHPYIINGIKVMFPVKAYPSQISIMSKVRNFIFKFHFI